MDNSIDSGNFAVRSHLPLIQKDYITHLHGLAVCVIDHKITLNILEFILNSIENVNIF